MTGCLSRATSGGPRQARLAPDQSCLLNFEVNFLIVEKTPFDMEYTLFQILV